MENKYYTPDIEDIRVGYECEVLPDCREEWFKWNMPYFSRNFYFGEIYSIPELLSKDRLRTPYLTKEQIEAEGWEITHREFKPAPYKVDWINAKKGSYDLYINLANTDFMHLGINKTKWGILFRGKCKSINEFRTICKLLNIK